MWVIYGSRGSLTRTAMRHIVVLNGLPCTNQAPVLHC